MRASRWMMGTFLVAGFAGALLWAQTPLAIKPGTTVKIQLKTRLDSKKSTVGEAVRAQIKQEIKQGHTVLLPKNGYLVGTVTAVAESEHGSIAKVGVLFNEVTDKKGNVLGHLRAAIIHIPAGSTNYSAMTISPELGGGTPPAMAGTGGPLTSPDRSSDGKSVGFALMKTFNGSGTDVGGLIESRSGNFHIDQDTHLVAQILQPGN
ncbi:MAG: hypothetical protein ACRD1F_09385 [Terriglobales bacterium]